VLLYNNHFSILSFYYEFLSQQDAIDFIKHLTVDKKASVSSQCQAFNAMLFLYRGALKMACIEIKSVTKTKRSPSLPAVLSQEEIYLIFNHLSGLANLVAKLLYGCGLLISECTNLRVRCFDFDAGVLALYTSKGEKDRPPIPQVLIPELKQQLSKVVGIHEHNMMIGYAGAFLPDQVDSKHEDAAKEFDWQWFFPAPTLTLLPGTQEYKRYHLMIRLYKSLLGKRCVIRELVRRRHRWLCATLLHVTC